MESNKSYFVWGAILLIVIVGVVMWNTRSTTPSVNNAETSQSETALTPNPDDVAATEALYNRAQTTYSGTRTLEGKMYVTTINYNGESGFTRQLSILIKAKMCAL